MNKNIIHFLFLITLLFSCGERYEEDPITVVFRGESKRILGEWHINKILIDNIDSTSLIYVDSLKICSYYKFEKYDKTYDSRFLYIKKEKDKDYYNFHRYPTGVNTFTNNISYWWKNGTENSPIIFEHGGYEIWVTAGYFKPYGPIGNFGNLNSGNSTFSGLITWLIKKLTTKEFIIQTTFKNRLYEIQFKKI